MPQRLHRNLNAGLHDLLQLIEDVAAVMLAFAGLPVPDTHGFQGIAECLVVKGNVRRRLRAILRALDKKMRDGLAPLHGCHTAATESVHELVGKVVRAIGLNVSVTVDIGDEDLISRLIAGDGRGYPAC